jgi:hypothetical protein
MDNINLLLNNIEKLPLLFVNDEFKEHIKKTVIEFFPNLDNKDVDIIFKLAFID